MTEPPAQLNIALAASLTHTLFAEASAYNDYRYEAAQQINALLQTVKNLEFEVEQYKKWLDAYEVLSPAENKKVK